MKLPLYQLITEDFVLICSSNCLPRVEKLSKKEYKDLPLREDNLK